MKLYAYIFSPLPESESSDIIKDQKKIIEQYCENNSYKLIKYYIDYNGNEYKKIKQQKQLAKLLYDIQKGYGLITCNINSLNFNITIVIDIMEKLKIKGVYLIDPMSNYDNYKNKDDILFETLMKERDKKKKDVIVKPQPDRRKTSYGWRHGGSGKPKIQVPEEQKVIQLIKDMVKKDPSISCYKIHIFLQNSEIPPPGRSKEWYYQRVNQIIKDNNILCIPPPAPGRKPETGQPKRKIRKVVIVDKSESESESDSGASTSSESESESESEEESKSEEESDFVPESDTESEEESD